MTRTGRGDIRSLDDYHLWTHGQRGTLDMRTPIVGDDDRVSWQLRPDLILQGCVKRGCRIKLYSLANGAPTLEIEPGGKP
jgi:hypothetical protein